MNDNKNHLLNSLSKNIRLDGRKSDEFRPVKVEYGISPSAEGSARVTIGDTVVIAGVKMSLETPYPDTPNKGNFMVNVELLPLSSPDFESGPPSIEAIELARVTDRGIRESNAIDTEKLCIKAGEKVWGVIVDICTINDDGNLFDASSLATLAAIKDAKFPKTVKVDDVMTVDYHEKTKDKVPLVKSPIGVTIWKMGNVLLADPTREEQKFFDARLTVASMQDGTLCAMQKGGDAALTSEEVSQMIDLALKKAKELRKAL